MIERDDIIVVGIGGASCGGKTTLVDSLVDRHPGAAVVHQDSYYKSDEEAVWNDARDTRLWDIPESLYLDKMLEEVEKCIEKAKSEGSHNSLIIIEGTMVLTIEALKPYIKYSWFMTLDNSTMEKRRRKRMYIGDPERLSYFHDYVWPNYMKDLKEACKAHKDGQVRMVDGTRTPTEILDEVDAIICELLEQNQS